jgi:hypothetical protein
MVFEQRVKVFKCGPPYSQATSPLFCCRFAALNQQIDALTKQKQGICLVLAAYAYAIVAMN